MKRLIFIALGLTILIGSVAFLKREPLMMGWLAAQTPATTLDARMALLEDAVEVRLPEEGAAPFPVVLQFHGCAGIRREFHNQWADVATDAGYAAMIVDSLGPRGVSREEALETVCDGEMLIGQERAGDVLAAIRIAERDSRLDTEQLVLAGWSHGAWSVMDYLTMDLGQRRPAGFPRLKSAVSVADGVILFYPYCGAGALSRFRSWNGSAPMIAFIAGADSIVDANECISLLSKRGASGVSIDMQVYPGTEHAFDDPFMEPEWRHWHDPAAFEDAKNRYKGFLTGLTGQTAP